MQFQIVYVFLPGLKRPCILLHFKKTEGKKMKQNETNTDINLN